MTRSDPTPRLALLFIQGAGKGAHAEDRAVAEALGRALGPRFLVCYPTMPGEEDPDKGAWQRTIGQEARREGATIVVGHSAGGATVADMLAQGLHRTGIPGLRGVFLLAPPFVGPGGWEFGGFHFEQPVSEKTLGGLPMYFYFGAMDTTVPVGHAHLYARTFPHANVRRLNECDHQFTGHLSSVVRDIQALVLLPQGGQASA